MGSQRARATGSWTGTMPTVFGIAPPLRPRWSGAGAVAAAPGRKLVLAGPLLPTMMGRRLA